LRDPPHKPLVIGPDPGGGFAFALTGEASARHPRRRPGPTTEASDMTVPTIFETCRPRQDILAGAITESDFAADLASVASGRAGADYRDPVRFFADTYPTRGLKNLLANVCQRLAGTGGEVAPIFRLDTSYGGGKAPSLPTSLRHRLPLE